MQTVVLIMLIWWKSTELEDDVGEWWWVGWGFTAGAAQTESTHITFNYNFKDTEWESYCKQSEHRGNSFQAKQNRFSFPQSCPAHKHISISTSCVFASAWPTQTVRFISLHWKWRETQCSCSSLAVSSWTALPVLKVQDTLRNMDCWDRIALLFWWFSPGAISNELKEPSQSIQVPFTKAFISSKYAP